MAEGGWETTAGRNGAQSLLVQLLSRGRWEKREHALVVSLELFFIIELGPSYGMKGSSGGAAVAGWRAGHPDDNILPFASLFLYHVKGARRLQRRNDGSPA